MNNNRTIQASLNGHFLSLLCLKLKTDQIIFLIMTLNSYRYSSLLFFTLLLLVSNVTICHVLQLHFH